MASQSVLELAVNTGKWDSGLKKAKSALDNFTTASGGLQQALGKDADKMQKFVQMMGSMDSKAKTAKGQMNDYKGTIEQLTMQYNRMTEAQQKTIGQDYLMAIEQLRQKYQAVNKEVQQMNRNLQQAPSTPKGGSISSANPFGNLTSKFTKANLYAMAAEKGVEAFQQLGSHIVDVLGQAQKLSAESEGIRNAFERLNRPDLLDKLREATHGTVSDLELMKQAVKFSDFKLSLDDLGTLLAFAQQKAKDTGQSVDYMVDSIVTGLGRKSLMILDNLGLSASEVKDRMKETGDMTTAVAGIIRDQMQQAGEYIETASDRLARGIADNENAMLKLGDAMRKAFGDTGLEEVVNILEGKLISDLTDLVDVAGQVLNIFNDIIGTDSGLADIASAIYDIGKELYFVLNPLMELYRIYQNLKPEKFEIIGGAVGNLIKGTPAVNPSGGGYGDFHHIYTKPATQVYNPESIAAMERHISELTKKWREAGDTVRDLYAAQIEVAKKRLAEISTAIPTGSVAYLNQQLSELRKEQQLATSTEVWDAYKRKIAEVTIKAKELKGELKMEGVSISDMISRETPTREGIIKKGQERIENFKVPEQPKAERSTLGDTQKLASGLQSVSSGLREMGIKLPDGVQKVIGVVQGVMNVIQGVQTILEVFGASSMTANTAMLSGNTAALGTLTGAVIANTAAITTNTVTPSIFAGGGIVHAAGGFRVPGNSFSGDRVPALLNSGELVLNTGQQEVVAQALLNNNGGGRTHSGSDYVSGQNIFLGTNNYLKGSGQGQLVTTRMLRQYGLIN